MKYNMPHDDPDVGYLKSLPADPGGIHIPFPLGITDACFGYYLYLPGGYNETTQKYPLLIFLHGAGEKGNNRGNPAILDKILHHGPPRLIDRKKWFLPYPMMVVSPQCHDNSWEPVKIHDFIAYIGKNYRINPGRIYLTGISMGGFGIFAYLQNYAMKSYVAAAVPICGGGNITTIYKLQNIPLWAFHGEADDIVPAENSVIMVNAINSLGAEIPARLTIYPDVGHDSWSMTYDGTGMGKESPDYDPFDISIYEWMFRYKKEIH